MESMRCSPKKLKHFPIAPAPLDGFALSVRLKSYGSIPKTYSLSIGGSLHNFPFIIFCRQVLPLPPFDGWYMMAHRPVHENVSWFSEGLKNTVPNSIPSTHSKLP